MCQLLLVPRPADIQQLVPDVAVERRKAWHHLAAPAEVEGIEQIEHDARRLLKRRAANAAIVHFELALGARQLPEQRLVALGHSAIDGLAGPRNATHVRRE